MTRVIFFLNHPCCLTILSRFRIGIVNKLARRVETINNRQLTRHTLNLISQPPKYPVDYWHYNNQYTQKYFVSSKTTYHVHLHFCIFFLRWYIFHKSHPRQHSLWREYNLVGLRQWRWPNDIQELSCTGPSNPNSHRTIPCAKSYQCTDPSDRILPQEGRSLEIGPTMNFTHLVYND